MSREVILENWSAVEREWPGCQRDPYLEEFSRFEVGNSLHGKVYGHPRIEDGHRVVTSRIRTINGNIVTTESETIYRLGAVNPQFVEPFSDTVLFTPEAE